MLLRRLIVLRLLQLDRFVELAFAISTFGVQRLLTAFRHTLGRNAHRAADSGRIALID